MFLLYVQGSYEKTSLKERQKPSNAKYNYENNEILEKNILGQTDFYKKLTYPSVPICYLRHCLLHLNTLPSPFSYGMPINNLHLQ